MSHEIRQCPLTKRFALGARSTSVSGAESKCEQQTVARRRDCLRPSPIFMCPKRANRLSRRVLGICPNQGNKVGKPV